METWERALALLPERFSRPAAGIDLRSAEEIRLRAGKRPTVLMGECEFSLADINVSAEDLMRILEKATGASLHAALPALQQGYLNYQGLRIGVCGTATRNRGEVEGFRVISSLAIRIPREYPGLCDRLIAQLYSPDFQNTLIVSPPGGGKTTALRDMIRGLSDRGLRLSVVDERNELSASDGAQAKFDLGQHSDILIGVPRAEGSMMLLRAMNPQILAMDEISSGQDMDALKQIVGCGVGILATAHARNLEDLLLRPMYRDLIDRHVFTYILTIRQCMGKRSYHAERLTQ